MRLQKANCLGDQWKAIMHKDGPASVISGPGTGKTTTIANRIVALVESGVDPTRILALTFNKAAQEELRQRSITLLLESGVHLEEVTAKDADGRDYQTWAGPEVRTYHSLGFLIAREVLELNKWEGVIVDPTWMIKYILSPDMPPLNPKFDKTNRRGMAWNDPQNDDDDAIDPKEALRELGMPWEQMMTPDELPRYLEGRWGIDHDDIGKWLQLYAMYQHEKQLKGKVTFDDMLYVAWLVLTGNEKALRYNVSQWNPLHRGPVVSAYKLNAKAHEILTDRPLRRWQSRWDYVLVDEAQDTNPLQGRVATMLAQEHQNLMVVGDTDQSIYKFRGASPNYIPSLMRAEFPGHKVYHLNYTRRFPVEIVDVANKLIEINPREDGYVSLKSARTMEHGQVVAHHYMGGEFDQAHGIVDEIRHILGEDFDPETSDQSVFDQIGVIYRTHATGAVLEPSLFAAGYPYRVMGGGSAFNRKEVVAAMAYMEAMTGDATFDELAAIVNIVAHDSEKTTNYLGAAALDFFRDWCNAPGREDVPPVDALWQLIYGMRPNYASYKPYMSKGLGAFFALLQRMKDLVKSQRDEEGVERATSIMFIKAARELAVDAYVKREYGERDEDGDSRYEVLVGLEKLAVEYPDPATFIALVRRLQDDAAKPKDEQKPAILLGTAHRWKGLERDIIIIMSMDNGIWPHKRTSGYVEGYMDPGMTQGDIPEERRLAFVAVTRARNVVHIGHFGSSMFCAEMGLMDTAPAEESDAFQALMADESVKAEIGTLAILGDEAGEPDTSVAATVEEVVKPKRIRKAKAKSLISSTDHSGETPGRKPRSSSKSRKLVSVA